MESIWICVFILFHVIFIIKFQKIIIIFINFNIFILKSKIIVYKKIVLGVIFLSVVLLSLCIKFLLKLKFILVVNDVILTQIVILEIQKPISKIIFFIIISWLLSVKLFLRFFIRWFGIKLLPIIINLWLSLSFFKIFEIFFFTSTIIIEIEFDFTYFSFLNFFCLLNWFRYRLFLNDFFLIYF